MAIEYNFKYMPLVGKLSGESMVQQTETAINEIAKIVNDNTAQAEIINTLAEQANANSVEALEKATEALDTSSRVYIKETLAVNLNNYCESQLIYINNVASQNLPIAHKGFLEVKTNDDKTQATQVFADDVDRKFYVRTGAITATTVGDVTTYTASYGNWVDIPNITDLDNYLALAGGTMSGDIQFSASEWKIKGSDIDNDAELSIVGATDNLNGSSLNLYGRNHTEGGAFELNANNGTYTKTLKGDASGNLKWDGDSVALAKDFLPLSGGTMTGNIHFNKEYPVISGDITTGELYVIAGRNAFDGASLQLFGRSDSAYAGRFYLRASTKSSQSDSSGSDFALAGRADGTLTWGGTSISLDGHTHSYLPLSGGTMTGNISNSSASLFTIGKTSSVLNQGVRFWGGGGYENGASLYLYGKSHTNAGQFILYAHNGTTSRALIGTPEGSLTWIGKEVERVNSIGSNYIRYENGIQICWGLTSYQTVNGNTDKYVTATFGAAFVNTNYTPQIATRYSSGSWQNNTLCIAGINTTSMDLYIKNNQGSAYSFYFSWFVIGKWK